LKLLIFSDIHTDWKTLERLLGVEADYYIAAGDQLTWSRGVERCGEILQSRGDKVYVLPATTNRPTWFRECAPASGFTISTSATFKRETGTSRAGLLQPDALQHAGRV